jgi:iron(III)-salmochelin esterase
MIIRPAAAAALALALAWGAACSPDAEIAPDRAPSQLDAGRVREHQRERETPSLRETEGSAVSVPRREPLAGYKTGGELLHLGSKRFPGAVVAVTLPPGYAEKVAAAPATTWPLVVAFGGAGECARSPELGALAWMRYYAADEAFVALGRGRLETADFRGLVTPGQLAAFNTRLRRAGAPDVILACPSSPPISAELPLDSPEYEAFLMEEVLPALTRSYPVDPARVGVDGVSMGGARAMYYGLEHPETFASLGAVQGAFARFMDLYRPLIAKNRNALRSRAIQLVTSDGDPLAPAVMAMHVALDREGIDHDLLLLTGPHDYIFNQGPGALSLLLFHTEALRAPRAR